MSPRVRMIAAAVGSVLVLAIFFFLFIKPRQSELSEVRQQISDEESQSTALQAELQHLQSLQQDAPQLRAELEEVEELVPDDHQVPNFIFQVQRLANESGVGFVQITPELPKSPPEGAALAEVRIQIAAEGGYFAIQDFARRLYDLDRALRIDTLGITVAEGDAADPPSLNITARIFFQPAAAAVGGATVPAPGTTPAPVTPAPVSPAPVTPAATPAG